MIKQPFLVVSFLLIALSAKTVTTTTNTGVDAVMVLLKTHQHDALAKRTFKDPFMQAYVDCQIEKNNTGTITKTSFDKFLKVSPHSNYQKALAHLNSGDYIGSNNNNEVSSYLDEYEQALRLGKDMQSAVIVCEALRRFCFHYLNTQKNRSALNEKVNAYERYTYDSYEEVYYAYYKTNYNMQTAFINNTPLDKAEIDRLLIKAKASDFDLIKGKAYRLKSVYFLTFQKDVDSAFYYMQQSKAAYSKKNTAYRTKEIIGLEINKAIHLNTKGLYTASITVLDSVKSLETPATSSRYRMSTAQYLKEAYYAIKKYDSAYKYVTLEHRIKEQQNLIEQDLKFAEIEGKYDTSEAENKILIEQQKKKQNKNIAIGLGVSLLLVSLVAFLLYNNIKRKQKIAEQQKALETQKLATVLKGQELNAIDAMIAGQEKERQRIANDLHDDLGSLMATIKLYFNSFKETQTPEILNKTMVLIDEAYDKVRTVAHAKNAGVMANQGLLIAVHNMVDKISATNTLQVTVIDHGLEQRIGNSLELSLFRILQELMTNIIKHAEATEARIYLTNHDASMNIMVEDNGKGFDTGRLANTQKGMGIDSIDKRITHLGGIFNIDSNNGTGTTVIIDVPVV